MSTDAELIERLHGKYAMGPHLPNGLPEFGFRQFETTPICTRAANRLSALIAERDRAIGQIATIHSIALEAKPHRGCACAICRIRRVCDGRQIDPDPGEMLPERLQSREPSA